MLTRRAHIYKMLTRRALPQHQPLHHGDGDGVEAQGEGMVPCLRAPSLSVQLGVCRCCLLLQDLCESCARGGGVKRRDVCYGMLRAAPCVHESDHHALMYVPLLFITAGACWAGRPEGARPGLGARRRWQDGLDGHSNFLRHLFFFDTKKKSWEHITVVQHTLSHAICFLLLRAHCMHCAFFLG